MKNDNLLLLLLPLIFLVACSNPGKDTEMAFYPEDMLVQLAKNQRFVSVDKVADWIINKDPSLVLVDVRNPEAFAAFSLPDAVNVPLNKILDPVQQKRMDCEKYNLVFFSNGTVDAQQAWMINRRTGCRNQFIMKGGLNAWAETILNPPVPDQTASSEELDLYTFRKAAAKYFIGASEELDPEPYIEPVKAQPVAEKKEIQPVKKTPPKKPAIIEEEGC